MQRSVVSPSLSGTGLDLDLALLSPEGTAGWAAFIAARLARGDGATALFTSVMRVPVTLRSVGPHVRPASAAEAAELRMCSGDPLYVREGLLLAGTVTCARTLLKVIPHRIESRAGPLAWAAVRSGRPCGEALAPYGLAPGRRDISVRPGEDPPVTARRHLRLRGALIGIACEAVPEALCAILADPGREMT